MKRIFDIVISSLAIIFCLPLFIVLFILIRVNLGSPVFFFQDRPGLNGTIFKMVKFRTMLNTVDNNKHNLPDSARLTDFGSKLRKTSLDELPELWNVLKGDMSLVGPRPLLVSYLDLYSEEQRKRHDVKPGITGWAQVNGRNLISWEEKFKLDLWYVRNHNLWIDLKILFVTIYKTIKREGISVSKNVTMEPFKGDLNE
jgi:lipopolysaccharide/colanic/teichoic acid biosynthesis glycosyltransferase